MNYKLYLIDLKGGVEFKQYATNRLPQAAVLAIDCEREFALSALDALCTEMRRRMDVFRASTEDINSIAMFRASGGEMPRILLVMDEFQKLLSESDDLADRARSRLETLLKEGRAFGIHLLLATQSLKGILLRGGSMEQISVRIVLKCSAEDSRNVLASDNVAGSTLPKFHGIYNDQQGMKHANVVFKAAHLPSSENRERLAALAARGNAGSWGAVVFEGNEKRSIDTCPGYVQAGDCGERSDHMASRIWLGDPVAIQPPVEVILDSGRARNLLVLMQDAGEGVGVLLNSLLSLLVQNRPEDCRFLIINLLEPTTSGLDFPLETGGILGHQIDVIDSGGLPAALDGLVDELTSRIQNAGDFKPCYVFMPGLQFSRDLRSKEAFGEPDLSTPPGGVRFLLRDGPEKRVHILAWCDALANFSRCGRGLIDEFGVIVGGRMEQSDSNSVFGSPAAARIHSVNRAVLADDARPGVVQVFRPYAAPDVSTFLTPEEI